jgi:hypothetical protein
MAPPLVAGAIAHLDLVMIHPFKDGNLRMARVLLRGGSGGGATSPGRVPRDRWRAVTASSPSLSAVDPFAPAPRPLGRAAQAIRPDARAAH